MPCFFRLAEVFLGSHSNRNEVICTLYIYKLEEASPPDQKKMPRTKQGIICFLVARGGIEPGPRMPDSISRLLNEKLGITLGLIKRLLLQQPAQLAFYISKAMRLSQSLIQPSEYPQ